MDVHPYYLIKRIIHACHMPFSYQGAFTRLDPTGQFKAMAEKRIPVGRMGEQEELSNLACYLVSDYSTWMNGEVGVVCGAQNHVK